MRSSRILLAALTLTLLLDFYLPAAAQDGGPAEPYYIVQPGDSLWGIAARFGIPPEDLQQANQISDPAQVVIGTRLIIPGLQSVAGQLDTITVPYGETLSSLSRAYGISEGTLARLNRFISPGQMYAGETLIVPAVTPQGDLSLARVRLSANQSLLELSALRGQSPWALALKNDLPGTWAALPGDVLRVAGAAPAGGPAGLPDSVQRIEVSPLPMIQGGTAVIKISAPPGMSLTGSLAGLTLNFFPLDDGYVALQGIHAMTPPGRYPLTLEGRLSGGEAFAFSQDILVQDANFPYDPSLEVDPATVDPAVTKPEAELWASLGAPATPDKMWNGLFGSPVPADFKDCWTSLFGDRRSYNGGTYDSFHSGLDFCGRVGTELYAVAPGKVVYTGSLIVRGQVVVIDHGWGIYTAYDHLSQILVQPGQTVQPGQVIGLGGATGRTTGPHLHWEVWVGGVQVNPVDWLKQSFP